MGDEIVSLRQQQGYDSGFGSIGIYTKRGINLTFIAVTFQKNFPILTFYASSCLRDVNTAT